MAFKDGDVVRVEYGALSSASRGPHAQPSDGRVWCPGSGKATILHTAATLDIADLPLPPGQYTLYVEPSQDEWILIISKRVGQRASYYPEGWDVARITMNKRELPTAVPALKFSLQPDGPKGGSLKLVFGKTEAWVDFHEMPRGSGMEDAS